VYYLYIEKHHSAEYKLVDLKEEIDRLLPSEIASRFDLSQLPFSLFGNEYILNLIGPDEVSALRSLFDEYKLPFVRLEPPFFNTRYVPELMNLPSFVGTISSHHLIWLRKKIAVCISGEFRHIVHRTPEGQVRELLRFLSGVDLRRLRPQLVEHQRGLDPARAEAARLPVRGKAAHGTQGAPDTARRAENQAGARRGQSIDVLWHGAVLQAG
jgi:hypothetical protein